MKLFHLVSGRSDKRLGFLKYRHGSKVNPQFCFLMDSLVFMFAKKKKRKKKKKKKENMFGSSLKQSLKCLLYFKS